MWALLIGDYMNTVMNEQTRHTLRIVGFAGALAALATWWVQSFAAKRGSSSASCSPSSSSWWRFAASAASSGSST
jgi:hypothetical protein